MAPGLRTTLAVLLACGALSPGAAALGQTVSLQRGGERATIAVGTAASLPADFPEDVFVPPSARLLRVERSGGRVLLEFELASEPAQVQAAYAGAMARAGWTPVRVRPLADASVRGWERDERAVLVAASAQAAGTRLQLQLLPRAGTRIAPR